MAAGRMILAAVLGAALVLLLTGNLQCTSPAEPPAPTPGGSAERGDAAAVAEPRAEPGADAEAPPVAPADAEAGTGAADERPSDAAAAGGPRPGEPGDADDAGTADQQDDRSAAAASDDGVERVTVEIAGETFRLELAADPGTRIQGLMGRPEIARDGGMLFVFPDVGLRSFWMKDCLTDMDILFLDASGRVTATHEMTVEPPRRPDESQLAYELRLRSYPSRLPAQFAIELAPGSLDRLGIRAGDVVPLDLESLKRRAR